MTDLAKFDWKNPDYATVWQERLVRLEAQGPLQHLGPASDQALTRERSGIRARRRPAAHGRPRGYTRLRLPAGQRERLVPGKVTKARSTGFRPLCAVRNYVQRRTATAQFLLWQQPAKRATSTHSFRHREPWCLRGINSCCPRAGFTVQARCEIACHLDEPIGPANAGVRVR